MFGKSGLVFFFYYVEDWNNVFFYYKCLLVEIKLNFFLEENWKIV